MWDIFKVKSNLCHRKFFWGLELRFDLPKIKPKKKYIQTLKHEKKIIIIKLLLESGLSVCIFVFLFKPKRKKKKKSVNILLYKAVAKSKTPKRNIP